ncbi:MAG: hypothetical protein BGO94_04200 [Micrococcales bacterium 72-143]|nr:MAG: hypothetical protein BGO94_04200 [Micrococcales bacterium 72-143]
MPVSPLLALVEQRKFRELFRDHLLWSNPDQPPLKVEVEGVIYTLEQVAGFKGLRVWHCAQVPPKRVQRLIDQEVGTRSSSERLLIFADDRVQAWRWPRRAQLGGANAKLVLHEYKAGSDDQRLVRQLEAIKIGFSEDLKLPDLLARMRGAFDHEAETASAQAARLMGTLYTELESAKWDERNATLLLARLLFLFFADDSAMWQKGQANWSGPEHPFHDYLANHTTGGTLSADLEALFEALATEEAKRRADLDTAAAVFRYVNGGLFDEPLQMGSLSATFRAELIAAGEFDWSIISPAIFGSMFQTVKDRKARRAGGEHYTTEESILKTIEPLFLTEFRDRLEAARGDKGQLTKLHNDLGRVRVLDPACGCGNFLIIAYRELRAIELDLLVAQRELEEAEKGKGSFQLSFDVSGFIKVTVDHFFGIEIEEWPARIAETAMLLVDHLANQRMEQDFGMAPDRLPIRITPTIVHANALRHEWSSVVPPSEDVIIIGNPPFIGQYTKTAEQTADAKRIWGTRYNGYLDYVTSWYALALKYYGKQAGRWAFVSTNSIAQGEGAEFLFRPIFGADWRVRFAHRSFQWLTEAPDGAAVHVSIIGFDRRTDNKPRAALWVYPEGGVGDGVPEETGNINAYLMAAPNTFVSSQTRPLSSSLPQVTKGSQPTDDGNFFVEDTDLPAFRSDPIAAKYLRPFVGARELLHDVERWCLWMVGADEATIERSVLLKERVDAVRAFRMDSKKPATRAKAATAHLFDERRQPSTSYLAIPYHVGQTREFFTAKRLTPDVICGNANAMTDDPDGFGLGVLSSTMFILWMRAIGGRIKSDLRFSNTFVYNSFPLPELTAQQRAALIAAAEQLVRARGEFPGKSLADLYEPGRIPEPVLVAHAAIDKVVDAAFGVKEGASVEDRQRLMLRRYAALTKQESDATLFDLGAGEEVR